MKLVLNIIIAALGLIALPVSLFGSWVLYNHVQATELMWCLWWFTFPLTILAAGIVKVP